ncbi:NifU family protein [Streptomyces tremellae]|uniref:NifU family protein n=1 Tax=Streptomyces tremellae TaxID=1124239 RepID=UPI0031E6BCC6
MTQHTAPHSEDQGIGDPQDWRDTGERVEALIAASAVHGTPARERSEELVRLITDFYGAGLERLLGLVHDHGALDDRLAAALAGDDLVASLLLVHGLHPYGVESRVERALDGVRPYLGSHGGDVQLLGVTAEGTVRLRLLGSCDGCPSSAATLELAVRGAVEAAAPEVTAIEVQAPAADGPAAAVVPVDALFSRVHEAEQAGGSWAAVPELTALEPGAVTDLTVGGTPVLACRIGTDLYAFRDACGRCAAPMRGATLARRLGGAPGEGVLRCPACGAHYDVRRAGACLDEDGIHLDPLPVLTEGAAVCLAVPAGAAT